MKKAKTVEEAMKNGYNSKKITQMVKEELGPNATKRRVVRRIEEARQAVEKA